MAMSVACRQDGDASTGPSFEARSMPDTAIATPDLRRIGSHPDHWYPLAWSDELKPGKTLARQFAGSPIVLYRGTSGQAYALEDRCAHRQVPLHKGVVNGDMLKCG